MDTKTILVDYFLLLAVSASVYCENCDNATSVSLSLMEYCDSYPEVTAICTVRNSSIISWNYNGLSSSCVGLCTTPNILCSNFNDVKVDCTCGDTVITSQATFNLSSDPGVIVFCEGQLGVKANVSGSIPSLEAPTLLENYSSADISSEMFEVTISWEESNGAPPNVEYVVDVANKSQPPQPYPPTNATEMNIILHRGDEYTLTVTAQLCDGKVRSNPSNSLVVFLEAQLVSSLHGLSPIVTEAQLSPIVTVTPTKETQNIGVIIGPTIAVAVIIVGAVVAVFLIISFCGKSRQEQNDLLMSQQSQGQESLDNDAELQIARTEKHEQHRQLLRTGVTAIHVDGEYIYYALIEKDRGGPGKDEFYVRKCKQNGKIETVFTCEGIVRGIGKHGKYLYVSISTSNSLILKFDDISGDRKKKSECKLGTACGLLVTSDYVLVCSRRFSDNSIIVLHSEDLVLCEDITLKLPDNFDVANIARFNNYYIIGGIGAFGVIECNFVENEDIQLKMHYACGEKFREGYIFRAVCASKKYIYVTEMNKNVQKSEDMSYVDVSKRGPIICYNYESEKFIEEWKINTLRSQNSGKGEIDYFTMGSPGVMDCREDPTGCDTLIFGLGFDDETFYIIQLLTSDKCCEKLFDVV